jgi:hypothetical protein
MCGDTVTLFVDAETARGIIETIGVECCDSADVVARVRELADEEASQGDGKPWSQGWCSGYEYLRKRLLLAIDTTEMDK